VKRKVTFPAGSSDTTLLDWLSPAVKYRPIGVFEHFA
jgi:hypothetical protein